MSVDGLSNDQRRFMYVENARARCEESSSASRQAGDQMEGIQGMMGAVFGLLGNLLKGIFSKGGMKGGGGGKGG